MATAIHLLPLLSALVVGCAGRSTPPPMAPPPETRPCNELVRMGREAAARGDSVRAEQYLSLALEQGADRHQVMPVLLSACLRSSHLRTALNHAEPYLLDHPNEDRLRYLIATIHLGLGQVAPAKRELGLLLQRNDQNADAHYLLGVIESGLDIEGARQHFLAVLRHGRDDEQRFEVESRLAELRLRELAARTSEDAPSKEARR